MSLPSQLHLFSGPALAPPLGDTGSVDARANHLQCWCAVFCCSCQPINFFSVFPVELTTASQLQTIFSMRAGVDNRLHGAIIAVMELALFFAPISIVQYMVRFAFHVFLTCSAIALFALELSPAHFDRFQMQPPPIPAAEHRIHFPAAQLLLWIAPRHVRHRHQQRLADSLRHEGAVPK